jgi:hypothetical protein
MKKSCIGVSRVRRPRSVIWQLALVTLIIARPSYAQDLTGLYRVTPGVSDARVEFHAYEIQPGQEKVLAELDGPAKVTYFYITDNSLFHRTDTSGFAYPGLVLKVYWDRSEKPSINVPLWEFFGNFNRETVDYASLPMQVNHWANICYLPMPFSKHARFSLENDGDVVYSRDIAFGIVLDRDPQFATETSRLHATWTRSNPSHGLHAILQIDGKGHYVGNILQVRTNYAGWWGEGDTIMTVDGHKFTHSPGTEDEYGSTWAGWQIGLLYSRAYVGNIQMETGKNRLYRWYVPDPVRFQKSLTVEIQNQRAVDGKQIDSSDDYTSVAFWYEDGAHPAPELPAYVTRIAASKGMQYPPEIPRR